MKLDGEVRPGWLSWQDVWSLPARLGASLLSSGWSPSEKPGGGGHRDVSQLSGKAQEHHHG